MRRMLLPVTEQSPQDSRPASAGGFEHQALPSLKIRRLPGGQGGGEAPHLGGLFQFHQEFFLHHLGHR